MSKVSYDIIPGGQGSKCCKCGKSLQGKKGYIKKSMLNSLTLGVMANVCCSKTCFNAKYN
jgi:hypothetical protein